MALRNPALTELRKLDWDDTGAGLRVSVTAKSADEPGVVVLNGVAARAR
jgi:hypothetical protein